MRKLMLVAALALLTCGCEKPQKTPIGDDRSARLVRVAAFNSASDVEVYRLCDGGNLLYIAARYDSRGGVAIVLAGKCE